MRFDPPAEMREANDLSVGQHRPLRLNLLFVCRARR